MEDLITKEILLDALQRVKKLEEYLDIANRREKIIVLEAKTQENGFWDDNKSAQTVLKDIKI